MLRSALHYQLSSQGQSVRPPSAEQESNRESEPVRFNDVIKKIFREARARTPDVAKAVVTIEAMVGVIRISGATTMMELDQELRNASKTIQAEDSSISVKAACELFLRYVTRTQLDLSDLSQVKARLIERGDKFAQVSVMARQSIAKVGQQFISNGNVIITHGYSQCVKDVLALAVKRGTKFKLVVGTGLLLLDEEKQLNRSQGLKLALEMSAMGVEVQVVSYEAYPFHMERANMVLVGAEGVVENGGIINRAGTLGLAYAAKLCNKPFYVAVESYKFTRMYPLSQYDPQLPVKQVRLGLAALDKAAMMDDCTPVRDYTNPKFISFLWTDLGVLTTAAVSDELIKLYS